MDDKAMIIALQTEIKYLHQIISAPKRGEKHEQMWEKLEYEIEHILAPYFSYDDKMKNKGDVMYVKKIMYDIKQKYFPKGDNNEPCN